MWPRPTLSISIAGWSDRSAPKGDPPRARIEAVAAWGFRAVQLDAVLPGIRARDLDRSARRDLAALLRRQGLAFTGLDLFIPPVHFADPQRVDRALAAAASACELAADLARLAGNAHAGVVCTTLPEAIDPRTLDALGAAADRTGVALADLSWPPASAVAERARPGGVGLGIGIDPAAVLMRGADPASAIAGLAVPVAAARLSDVSAVGRVVPGSPGGRLDVLGYAAALHTRGFAGAVVADLRGLPDAAHAGELMLAAWRA